MCGNCNSDGKKKLGNTEKKVVTNVLCGKGRDVFADIFKKISFKSVKSVK